MHGIVSEGFYVEVENSRLGEIIETSTAEFTAQCYELYGSPPLGSLVKTADGNTELYGIVCQAVTAGIDPARRPIARGKDEASEEDIYRSSPQLEKLLRTEFTALVVGHKRFDPDSVGTQHRENGRLFRYLPPKPARIHSFVYQCSDDEVREFGKSFDFLNMLLNARLEVPAEEVAAAALRQLSEVHPDPQAYLVAAGKELAVLLSNDFNRLRAVLGRIKT
ncbi:MAG: hypothetical protein HYX85_01635 [Chloroflexi bacterium]|nr:hypothetical protein [Chloroflexota bacterium]